MPLASALARGLSFRKNKDQDSKKPYFQAAPDRHGFDIKKTWIVSGRQPGRHSALQPHQISALTDLLSLPPTTPMLATRIAALGPPLTRPSFTNAPNCLCHAHTWFELRFIEELVELIGKEIGPRLAKLRTCPRDLVSPQTEDLLQTLEPYIHLFPAKGAEAGHSSDDAVCHRQNCSLCNMTNCVACRLSLFMQNSEAVRAVETSALGRKKKRGPWPELSAWLDPEPGIGWESKWMRQGNNILKDRIGVRQWGIERREAKRRGERVSGHPEASADAEVEEFDVEVQEEESDNENENVSVRRAEVWAQSYNNLVSERPRTEWYSSSLHVDRPRQSYGATDTVTDSQYWEELGHRERYGTEEWPQTEWYNSSHQASEEHQASQPRESDGAISTISGREYLEDEIPGESYQASRPRESYGATEVISMYAFMGDRGPREFRQTRMSGFMR
ncbi:hypothetical protein ABVK25_006383 [Lepraria finkii]|uniref:Uncharacterized protein n=1 Tax=Lepraria finkii TaxID=1340010 RepID=A0ABR4B953_9LECA